MARWAGTGGGTRHLKGLNEPYFLHGGAFWLFRALLPSPPPFSGSDMSSLNEEPKEPLRVGDVADGFSPW
jgi:hypothetical protein